MSTIHFSKPLIKWYQENKRRQPWRETNDPYKIWVSEVMMQQTQAITVIPYYNRFIKMLPTVKDLAEVDERTLLNLWEGLGYYSRALNMKKAAIVIMGKHHGLMPKTFDELIKLKGIGIYTAGAIMSIAYGEKYPATDGNVLRVLSRYYGIKDDIRDIKTVNKIRAINKRLMIEPTSSFTQGLFELGAMVCKKSKPLCDICPVSKTCISFNENLTEVIPYKSKSREKRQLFFQTFILEDEDGNIILEKQQKRLLRGLYLYPQIESENLNYAKEELKNIGIDIIYVEKLDTYKHIFTHLIWHMDVYIGRAVIHNNDYLLVKKDKLDLYPMGTAHKKIK